MKGDAELRAFRADHYGLFVSLLWREPSADVLASVVGGADRRIDAATRVQPLLGEGWRRIAASVADVETVAEEYTRLFLGPFGADVNPYESYYLTGHVLDRPLAALRADLAEIDVKKDDRYAEPEDFLAVELDVMRRLLERQARAGDPATEERWLDAQAAFLKRHLLVWAPSAARDLAAAPHASFYAGVGLLLQGFLEVERELFAGWGDEPLVTLEEARRRLGAPIAWKGPVFDP